MKHKNGNLDRIEAQLRALFEEKLLWVLTGNKPKETLINDLMDALTHNIMVGESERSLAPDHFRLTVSPEDLPDWQAFQFILDDMAGTIHSTAQIEGLDFRRSPTIELESSPDIPHNDYTIEAFISPEDQNLPDTSAMEPEKPKTSNPSLPDGAMLIIGGSITYPLHKSVINIGRHSENDLVLDDLHVSRHHAQLRAINRKFIIFDVGSTGGVFINGKKVNQATLQNGDVILLGVTNLIYVQETTSDYQTTILPVEGEFETTGDDHSGDFSG